MEPELIQITVVTSGPYTSFAQDASLIPEPAKVALGNEQVTLYDRGSAGTEILRLAETTSGGHPMMFEMHYLAYGHWDPTIARRDVSLFLAMLQSFKPSNT